MIVYEIATSVDHSIPGRMGSILVEYNGIDSQELERIKGFALPTEELMARLLLEWIRNGGEIRVIETVLSATSVAPEVGAVAGAFEFHGRNAAHKLFSTGFGLTRFTILADIARILALASVADPEAVSEVAAATRIWDIGSDYDLVIDVLEKLYSGLAKIFPWREKDFYETIYSGIERLESLKEDAVKEAKEAASSTDKEEVAQHMERLAGILGETVDVLNNIVDDTARLIAIATLEKRFRERGVPA